MFVAARDAPLWSKPWGRRVDRALLLRCEKATIVRRENATMMIRKLGTGFLASAMAIGAPAAAQRSETVASAQNCELHVWPTRNYEGISMGLLSGFGAIGGGLDAAANAGKVKTVKGRMEEFLGPNDQLAELDRVGVQRALKLDGYRLVPETPIPSKEDAKHDPSAKAQREAMQAKLKNGERLSTSTAPCYAELVGTQIFYMKAALYGRSIESDWTFRIFPPSGKAQRKLSGSGKTKLVDFPPETEADVPAAKADLRAAYAADFVKFVEKKLTPRPAAAR
jgi:hypothetical protein